MNRIGLFIETAKTLEARGREPGEHRSLSRPQRCNAESLLPGQRTGMRDNDPAARLLPAPRCQPPAKRGRGKVVQH